MKLLLFRTIIFFILVFLVNSLVYSDNEKNNQSEQATKKATEKEANQKVSREQIKKTGQPAEFIPSEKIQSDSSVSFPVDI